MIKFKQKEFAGAALSNAVMIGSSVLGVAQGSKGNRIAEQQGHQQMKQNEKFQKEQMRQNAEFQKQQMKQQREAARIQARAIQQAGGNGVVAVPQAGGAMQTALSEVGYDSSQKMFAGAAFSKAGRGITKVANNMANSGTWRKISSNKNYKELRGFASDIGKVARQKNAAGESAITKAADMAGMGVMLAGGGYIADKAIQIDKKRRGEAVTVQDQQKTRKDKIKAGLGAAVGTAGAVGTTLVLARRGKLNSNTFKKIGNTLGDGIKNQFYKKAVGEKTLAEMRTANNQALNKLKAEGASARKLKRVANKQGRDLQKAATGHVAWGNIAINGAFAAMPAMGYISERMKDNSQVNQTATAQRSYAIPAAATKSIASGFSKTWRGIKSAPKTVVNFLSFGADRGSQQAMGKKLKGLNSSNRLTNKAANFLSKENPNFGGKAIRTVGGLVAGSTIMMAPWTVGERVTKKAIGAVDKSAYAYEKSQNQQVQ